MLLRVGCQWQALPDNYMHPSRRIHLQPERASPKVRSGCQYIPAALVSKEMTRKCQGNDRSGARNSRYLCSATAYSCSVQCRASAVAYHTVQREIRHKLLGRRKHLAKRSAIACKTLSTDARLLCSLQVSRLKPSSWRLQDIPVLQLFI